jgi:glycosyltransferase involved in cell wall biosynthesis
LKILHVSPSFYPATHYGGTIASGYGLCNALAKMSSVELRVLTTDSDGPGHIEVKQSPTKSVAGYDIYYCHRWFSRDVAPSMFPRLVSMIRWTDVVHLTAVYSPPTIPTLMLAHAFRKPVVWSVRGALQRWNGSTRTSAKQWWESLCNLTCDPERVILHVTSEEEKNESIRRIPNARVAVIPNGIDVPLSIETVPPVDHLRLLYLGRLHPIKGIENLLRAMTRLQHPATLSISGVGDSQYERKLRSMVNELQLTGSVTFHGPVSGEVKERQFAEADVCVVPSYKENFCMVVVESLAHGVPVVASLGTPWSRLEEMGCGLWVSNEEDQLAAAIDRIGEMTLREMGARGRDWMVRDFSWQTVADRMMAEYLALMPQQKLERDVQRQPA